MKVFDKSVNIELLPATVMQVDKYARTGLFTDNTLPLSMNRMHTNVVFQLQQTGKILPVDIADLQPFLYKKQKVDIIKVNQFVVGYVDLKNEEYYYTTTDFCNALNVKFPGLLAWLISITMGVIILAAVRNTHALLFVYPVMISIWIIHWVLKHVLNKRIENAIDDYMKTLSIL